GGGASGINGLSTHPVKAGVPAHGGSLRHPARIRCPADFLPGPGSGHISHRPTVTGRAHAANVRPGDADASPPTTPCSGRTSMKLLIVTAVDAERDAVLRGIGAASHDVHTVGVGPAAAAATTARLLALAECCGTRYDGVVNAGIAGSLEGRAAIG